MNSEELVASFQAQGFEYLSTAECLQFINDAYLIDICEQEDWPFLEATAEGPSPLEVSDLRTVEYVIDTTQQVKLDPLIKARLTDDHNVDLTEAGSPLYYYVSQGTTIKTFPSSSTSTLLVSYWRFPQELSGTAKPVFPKRFHSLIVDAARSRGYENSDDWELAQVSKARFEERFQHMRTSLLSPQHDQADDYIVVTDPYAC